MSERKINLENIILEVYGCKNTQDFQKCFDVSISMIKEIVIKAISQTLELAAENAYITTKDKIDGILNTIKQIE